MKTKKKNAGPSLKGAHVLIVEARFYDDNADRLLDGAVRALKKGGATHELVTVPGILELPAAVQFAFTGKQKKKFAGAIVLGCAVKGETDHYEHVCHESMGGMTRVALDHSIPVGNGILTCPTWELAQRRADPDGEDDVGGRAARACLRMIELKRRFG